MKPINDPSLLNTGISISGYYLMSDAYATHRPKGMTEWLITYTLRGKGYMDVPSGMQHCIKGDITFLRPGTPHRYGTVKGEEWDFYWAHFNDYLIEDNLLPSEPLFIHNFKANTVQRRINQAFRRLLFDSTERDEYWQELCLNSLREMLMLLAQEQKLQRDPRIVETIHYLSIHMRDSVQIEELARTIGLSSSRLSHLFKEQTGLSIIDTLNQMRIRQAALLLTHTNRSASEICYEVGFHNYNHFINQFRKWYGLSPSSYKRKHT
ncbi:AraC family transcriptional regulator [Paenibacillus algicola]|uniref:AraC family transcriptional regulator n=1 Tax=Paenibacillus algicola TaxID=2565926 RepID=A0A4P8XJH3_9BACL|nr:helix-turn-helix domain-containing protein [Paenibacillus algicola]QCT01511.1 AraC family transcriptional regulator [Paenibacillus algicola]